MSKVIYDRNGYLFVKKPRTGEVRGLRPTFANAFWEVYTIFSPEGIDYRIVGINGERRSYGGYGGLSRSVVYYEPAGYDLIYHNIDAPDWHLLSLRDGKLCDITQQLANSGEKMPLMVTHMAFEAPFLWMHVKGMRCYEKDCYFRQGDNGYETVSAEMGTRLRRGFF